MKPNFTFNFILLAICSVQTVAIFYLVVQNNKLVKPKHQYFATTQDGRLINMNPLSHPTLSNENIMTWVAQSINATFSINGKSYRRELQEASSNYTNQGWQDLTRFLRDEGHMEQIKRGLMNISVSIDKPPKLIKEEIRGHTGYYSWYVQVPVTLVYGQSEKVNRDKLLLDLLIVRIPRLESAYGIGIEQISFKKEK